MLGAREYDETGIGETGRFTDSRTAVTSATSCKVIVTSGVEVRVYV